MTATTAPPASEEELDELDETAGEGDEEFDDEDAGAAPVAGPATVTRSAAPGPRVVAARTPAPAPPARPLPQAGPRRVGRIDPAAARRGRPARPGSTAAVFEPLAPDDAAIPFDRVPYVPADLRRVAIMAGVMVVLIIVAAIIVTATVK